MGWITMNGVHILIGDGETKAQAVKRFIASKSGGSKTKSGKSKSLENRVDVLDKRIEKEDYPVSAKSAVKRYKAFSNKYYKYTNDGVVPKKEAKEIDVAFRRYRGHLSDSDRGRLDVYMRTKLKDVVEDTEVAFGMHRSSKSRRNTYRS